MKFTTLWLLMIAKKQEEEREEKRAQQGETEYHHPDSVDGLITLMTLCGIAVVVYIVARILWAVIPLIVPGL